MLAEKQKFGASSDQMGKQLLNQCLECKAWTLSNKCTCGGVARAAAPIKWSPEDHHAEYRRRLDGVEEEGWANKLPTLPDLTEEE